MVHKAPNARTGHYFIIKAELVEVRRFGKIIDRPISLNRRWYGEQFYTFLEQNYFAIKLTKHIHVTVYLIFFIQQERHDFLEEKHEYFIKCWQIDKRRTLLWHKYIQVTNTFIYTYICIRVTTVCKYKCLASIFPHPRIKNWKINCLEGKVCIR